MSDVAERCAPNWTAQWEHGCRRKEGGLHCILRSERSELDQVPSYQRSNLQALNVTLYAYEFLLVTMIKEQYEMTKNDNK